MIDWHKVRAYFPALEKCVYLNTAGGAPISRQAEGEVKRYVDEIYQCGDTKWDEWLHRSEDVRRRLAAFLKVSANEIAFLPNASVGMNVVADLLGGEGEVLTLADEFPSVSLPWLNRSRPVRFLTTEKDGSIDIQALKEEVKPETECLAASHVQYRTGFRFDLAALGRLCRSKGLRLAVDGTQSFGAFPIDVRQCHIDALVFSGYKWSMAGYGIAALYVRKEILETRPLPAVGWRSAKAPYELVNDRLVLSQDARALELGHPPFPGIFALGGTLTLLEEIGIEAIETRIHELTEILHARLERAGIPIRSTRGREHRSGITMVGVKEPTEITARLKEKNVFVSARGDSLRVSLHFYNNEEDIHRLMHALTDSR
ncbi:MAG: aminotransferase class V-fold PLP-dependent enzyme [Acidobacteriota bacterium]